MFNEMIMVSVTPFSGTTTSDKNGKYPVMLQLIAGKMPNRNVISGTVAERTGLEVGRTYLLQVREQGVDEFFGRDFNFVKIKELTTGEDIAKTKRELGDPDLVTIKRSEKFKEEYERKGDAVEGLRTKRIKEGHYKPTFNKTGYDHETAREVHEGSSVDSDRSGDLYEIFNKPLPEE